MATISSRVAMIAVIVTIVSTGAFNSHTARPVQPHNHNHNQQHSHYNYNTNTNINTYTSLYQRQQQQQSTVLNGWLSDTFQSLGLDIALEKVKYNPPFSLEEEEEDQSSNSQYGTVIRTAAKEYQKQSSQPSSSVYTTRKEAKGDIFVGPEGVHGDYNHYRTLALNSTPDRAVSILTTDVLQLLREGQQGVVDPCWKSISEGDLGENITVDGVDFTFFEVGKSYKFYTKGRNNAETENGTVVVMITERIEPCGNLCKLPFINNANILPKDRLERCQKFLLWLDRKEGLRGWYGKIVGNGGAVKLGDHVAALTGTVPEV